MRRDVVTYILGIAVGCFAGYLTAYIRLNKKHAKEMAECEEYYENRIAQLKGEKTEADEAEQTSEKSEKEAYNEIAAKYRPSSVEYFDPDPLKCGDMTEYEPTKRTKTEHKIPSSLEFDDYEAGPTIIDPIQFSDMMDDLKDPESVFFNGNAWEFLYMMRDGKLMNSENLKLISADRIMEGDLVPADFVDHFGEYEDDSVYVYNPNCNAVIEILMVDYTFDEYYEKEMSRIENSKIW